MRIAVPKEIMPGERRVALVPESIKRLVKKGFEVVVEQDAGAAAGFLDKSYIDAGATVAASANELYAQADLVAKVNPPVADVGDGTPEVARFKEGTSLIAYLAPLVDFEGVKRLAERKVTAFSMELVPRTTLAQTMDALSSMSTVTGYKAVLLAAEALPKFFPMLTTAAGTVPPAKVLIIGAGVAGLQAIATARRLGGVVEAFDQRPAVKEQVESLGGRFVEVPSEGEDAETKGGYAKELSDAYKQRQAELLQKHVAKSDVVITTALIPGKRAPILLTDEMVKSMAPGSVVVDLAADMGGNVVGTEPGKTVVKHGVTIIAPTNFAATMPNHASMMYSRNVEKLLLHLATSEGFKMDRAEIITAGSLVTTGGEVVHEMVRTLMNEKGVPANV